MTAKSNSARSLVRFPVLLNAVVYPGAGQFMQRRWLPAIFFTLSFTVALALFLYALAIILIRYYRLGFSQEVVSPLPPGSLRALGVSFAASLLLYLAALLDAYRAGVIAQRRTGAARMAPPGP